MNDAQKGLKQACCLVQRVMNARQFGLKLIANVTYGYTSAGFSGRMPMAEIADSIVQVRSCHDTTAQHQILGSAFSP